METKKHIHMIYRSSDGKLHCEQYPVVYRNKHYIYYKRPGHDQLDYISKEPREEITLEDVDDITTKLNNHKWVRVVTWFIDDFVRDALIHNMYTSEIQELCNELAKCEFALSEAKTAYDRAGSNYRYVLDRLQTARKIYSEGDIHG